MALTPGSSAISPAADAVFAALNVPALTGLATLRQSVIQGTPFPYVRIGDWTEIRDDTLGKHGRQLTVATHVFAGQPSAQLTATAIFTVIVSLLEYVAFPVAGWTLVACWFDGASTQLEDVNGQEVVHLIGTFRIKVRE